MTTETTHPTDLDTLLKEERARTAELERRYEEEEARSAYYRQKAEAAEHKSGALSHERTLSIELLEGYLSRSDIEWEKEVLPSTIACLIDDLWAAEASVLTARRDALEEAAKVADREQDECAEHEDNAFTDSVAARWSAAADAAHRIAAGIRTLASTVPGGEETRRTLTRAPERPELERLLREAAKRPMTPAEMREQRKSWVRGQLGLAHPEWDADDLRRRVDAADEAVYGPHEMKEEDLG
jgi:hypothetical protein